MKYHLAVDAGGTQLRAACFPVEQTTPSQIARISTEHPTISALARLEEVIQSVWPEDGYVENIAVAAPGPTDPYSGIIYEAPNIPAWIDLPLRDHLQQRFGVPVFLGNDANLAAMGEWKFGAGRGHHHLVYLTVSTGIGGGVILDDRLVLGKYGLAAELGHLTILPDGPLCGCGQRGHLEAVASGTGIAHWVAEQLANGVPSILLDNPKISAKTIADAAHMGDQLAISAYARAGDFLGMAIVNFLHTFNPSIIILGGGVFRSQDLLMEPIQAALPRYVMTPSYLKDLEITTAALGDDAGLMGALALARSQSETSLIR